MNHNRIAPEPVNSQSTQISNIQLRLCEHFRRRQAIWYIFFCILFVLIISGMVIGKTISLKKMGNTPGTVLSTTTTTTTSSKLIVPLRAPAIDIHPNATWLQTGSTAAGGNEQGDGINQLNHPKGLYVDDDQTVYVADLHNYRIVEWKSGATSGQVVAGLNGQQNGIFELLQPSDVIVDKEIDSPIICDYSDHSNRRVVRWPRGNGTSGETIISNISCWGLTMDENGSLYVTDILKHEVRRYRRGESEGTVVAGGNGMGNRSDQLNSPAYVFVDRDHSVYVSDWGNHRVMKWVEGAKQGIVVAGGKGQENGLTQLSSPQGVVVDQLGTVYVAEEGNHRIIRWVKGAAQGSVIVGGNGKGGQPNQLNMPQGLSFDRHGNLYVADWNNQRVQKFNIEKIVPLRAPAIDIHPNAKWQQNGLTVAGGNGQGNGINQLSHPYGSYVDDDQTVYVADGSNHRIVEWKWSATTGQVVAGGNGTHQLLPPTDVIVDEGRDSLIICDRWNKRVVRWPRENGTSGETIISNISCWGLTMDENGSLYATDEVKHEVRRYRRGESEGIVVAGGNRRGNRLDQLSSPKYVFVDRNNSLYVSDYGNHRVMKWAEGAKQGIVVAGGQGEGNGLTQVSYPSGVVVDQLDTVYVAEEGNHRIIRWVEGATEGSVIVGGNGKGGQPNQLCVPIFLSFDRHGNLYVADWGNARVQKFNIEKN